MIETQFQRFSIQKICKIGGLTPDAFPPKASKNSGRNSTDFSWAMPEANPPISPNVSKKGSRKSTDILEDEDCRTTRNPLCPNGLQLYGIVIVSTGKTCLPQRLPSVWREKCNQVPFVCSIMRHSTHRRRCRRFWSISSRMDIRWSQFRGCCWQGSVI